MTPMHLNRIEQLRRAQGLVQQNALLDAQAIAQELLRRDKNDFDAVRILAETSSRMVDNRAAISHAERMIRIKPSDRDGYLRLGTYLNIAGRHKEAINILKKLVKIHPQDADAQAALGYAFEMGGDLDAALELIKPHVDAGTETADMAYLHASIHSQRKRNDDALRMLLRHVNDPGMTPRLRESYFYLLGRIYETLGDIDHAVEAYARANALAGSVFDLQARVKWLDDMMEIFSGDGLKRLPRANNQSRLPVFILCWPRSGSTLVERIIGAHPKVHAAGERQDATRLRGELSLRIGSNLPFPQCIRDLDQNDVDRISSEMLDDLRKLAPKAQRITDKATSIWDLAGLLSLLFPKAVFIDLRREAVDNCLACWTSAILGNHPFNSDLKTIGIARRKYEQVMDHWHQVLDVPMLRVNYEDVVADQEGWSRKIIEFCGLEWDDRVLRFHESAGTSSTAAPTLSYQQTRQPIYRSSVGRAAKFARHLGPLYEGLGLETPMTQEAPA